MWYLFSLDLDGNIAEKIANDQLDAKMMSSSDNKVFFPSFGYFPRTKTPFPRFYGNHIKREIIFLFCAGPVVVRFLQSIINIQQAGEIYNINSWIKENFRNAFAVEELAEKTKYEAYRCFIRNSKVPLEWAPAMSKDCGLPRQEDWCWMKIEMLPKHPSKSAMRAFLNFTRDYRKMFGLTPKRRYFKTSQSKKRNRQFFFVEMGKLYSITPVKIRIYLNWLTYKNHQKSGGYEYDFNRWIMWQIIVPPHEKKGKRNGNRY